MDEWERIDERPHGMFYCGPMVGAKSSYQNLEPRHVRVDAADVGLQNKGLKRSSKNMSEEK